MKRDEIAQEARLLHFKALFEEARDFLERDEIRAVVKIHVTGARNDHELLRLSGEPVGIFGKFDRVCVFTRHKEHRPRRNRFDVVEGVEIHDFHVAREGRMGCEIFRGRGGRELSAFNGQAGKVWDVRTKAYDTPAKVARDYKNHAIQSVIVGDDNYGEGSSREHAAMEPRYLDVAVVLAKSLARIHESNLKKQGVLALTFVDPKDYDKIREKDRISVLGMDQLAPGKQVTIELTHEDGSKERFQAQHSYNAKQLAWFRAGSAINYVVAEEKKGGSVKA